MSEILKRQSSQEELANAITHGLGLIAGLIFAPFLLYRVVSEAGTSMLLAVSVFLLGLTLTYFSSTMYHLSREKRAKKLWKTADHISIFYLIGGTYFPLILAYLEQGAAMWFLAIMWGIILAGTILKIFFTGKYEILSLALYLFLGFMLLFRIDSFWQNVPDTIMGFIIAGGVAYTAGVYFYLSKRIVFSHAIWHVLVILGTVLHSIAIWLTIH